jgi:hypothetical protein
MKEVLSAVSSSISNAKESGACDMTDKHESITKGYEYYNIVVIVSLFIPHFFFHWLIS